jgi:hypothetical protein
MGSKTAGVDDGALFGVGDRSWRETNRPAILLGLGIAAAIGLLLLLALTRIERRSQAVAQITMPALASWPTPRPATPPMPTKVAEGVTRIESPEGRLIVQYRVQVDPSTTTGSTLNGVRAIEFHPGYISVIRADGGGQVFFADRTKEFTWSMGGQTNPPH